jgi:hypothetical protein
MHNDDVSVPPFIRMLHFSNHCNDFDIGGGGIIIAIIIELIHLICIHQFFTVLVLTDHVIIANRGRVGNTPYISTLALYGGSSQFHDPAALRLENLFSVPAGNEKFGSAL